MPVSIPLDLKLNTLLAIVGKALIVFLFCAIGMKSNLDLKMLELPEKNNDVDSFLHGSATELRGYDLMPTASYNEALEDRHDGK
jgi:hypothetical protein